MESLGGQLVLDTPFSPITLRGSRTFFSARGREGSVFGSGLIQFEDWGLQLGERGDAGGRGTGNAPSAGPGARRLSPGHLPGLQPRARKQDLVPLNVGVVPPLRVRREGSRVIAGTVQEFSKLHLVLRFLGGVAFLCNHLGDRASEQGAGTGTRQELPAPPTLPAW